jgi:predicted nucleic acid-binding protein
MTLVVDASIAIRWLFPVNPMGRADELVQRNEPLIAPDLVIAEITNTAWKLVAFEGLAPESAATIISAAEKGFDELVPSVGLKDLALQIAINLKHPAYDCFYLALAEQRECQMVTADNRLLSRCAGTEFARRIRPLLSAR